MIRLGVFGPTPKGLIRIIDTKVITTIGKITYVTTTTIGVDIMIETGPKTELVIRHKEIIITMIGMGSTFHPKTVMVV